MLKVGVIYIGLGLISSVFAADAAGIIKSKCASCHGQSMEKSAMGKSHIVKDMSSEMIEKSLQGYKEGKLNMHGMGSLMHNNAKNLSNEDIKALAKYIPTIAK